MENTHRVKIREIEAVTRDVGRFVTDKPENYRFTPGQAASLAIDDDKWKEEERPFTFTSLPNDPNLEFTVKIYPERDGVTDQLAELEVGSELLIGDPWGAFEYKGPGTFIAGGAGITPFIAILRQLEKEEKLKGNQLFFSNETEDDIILAGELKRMLGEDAVFTVTGTDSETYETGRIDREFLEKHVENCDQHFYVCGPPEMVQSITTDLDEMGVEADKIVTEDL